MDGSTGQNFRMHARDTRLSVEVRGPVQTRELRMFGEIDFAEGTGYTLRLRHAYGTYATANLLWWFLPGRAWFGGEYLFGWREVESGSTGQASRVEFAFKFFLP